MLAGCLVVPGLHLGVQCKLLHFVVIQISDDTTGYGVQDGYHKMMIWYNYVSLMDNDNLISLQCNFLHHLGIK